MTYNLRYRSVRQELIEEDCENDDIHSYPLIKISIMIQNTLRRNRSTVSILQKNQTSRIPDRNVR